MRNIIRLIALTLSVFIMMALFGACKKNDQNVVSSDTSSLGLSNLDVKFVDENGKSVYNVIRSGLASETEVECATTVFRALRENFNISPKNLSDEYPEENRALPILVGNTNFPETAAAIEELNKNTSGKYNEYIICTIGNAIVIWGRDDSSLKSAVDVFISKYLVNDTVTGGIFEYYSSPEGFDEFTIFGSTDLSAIRLVRPIYNVSYIVQLEIDRLINDVMLKTGYKFKLVEDQVASKTGSVGGTLEVANVYDYEIIVGNCARDGIRNIKDKEEYEIRIEDKKIYLNGGSPYSIAMAVSEFGKILNNKKGATNSDSIIAGNYYSVINNYDTAKRYTLSWSDDFDGTEIDLKKWKIKWDELSYAPHDGGKISYRGSSILENNYVKDGMLYLEARETDNAYYGGLLTNHGMFQYRFGYTELSTIHTKGEGFWSALYTMSSVSPDDKNSVDVFLADGVDNRKYYSETDIDETYSESGSWCWTHVHAAPTRYIRNQLDIPDDDPANINPSHKHYAIDDRGFWMDLHTFGYEWLDNTKVVFYIDGKKVHQINFTSSELQEAFSQAVFMRIGLAVGTEGHPALATEQEWKETNKYIIDYIHVYQLKGQQYYHNTKNGWKTYTVK